MEWHIVGIEENINNLLLSFLISRSCHLYIHYQNFAQKKYQTCIATSGYFNWWQTVWYRKLFLLSFHSSKGKCIQGFLRVEIFFAEQTILMVNFHEFPIRISAIISLNVTKFCKWKIYSCSATLTTSRYKLKGWQS